MRAWGNLKDLWGREWKKYYSLKQRQLLDDDHRSTSMCFTEDPFDPYYVHRVYHNALPAQLPAMPGPNQAAVIDVREAVKLLKPKERDAVESVLLGGMSRDEYAIEQGITPHAVTVRLVGAKKKLRVLLGDYA